MTTGLFTDETMLLHQPGPMHPESPARLRGILDLLQRSPLAGLETQPARAATAGELTKTHDVALVNDLQSHAGRSAQLDEDTLMSPRSHEAALLAAGASIDAVASVLSGRFKNAFALVRPPGHHAEKTHAMGFCLFNNIALAAESALSAGLKRVAIVDFDVHHGNGTQHLFEGRDDVLFFSLHQGDFYPGTGLVHEIGTGKGTGYTLNAPLRSGATDADVGAVFNDVLLPALHRYRPEMILVSAGYDAHTADPLGELDLTERGYAAMISSLHAAADSLCQGRLMLALEGGYDISALANSVHASLEVLTGGRTDTFPSGVSTNARNSILSTRVAHRASPLGAFT